MKEDKRCPLFTIATAIFMKSTEAHSCLRELCAWYIDGGCAITKIALNISKDKPF